MEVTDERPFYTSTPPYYMTGFWIIICFFPYIYYKDKNNILFLTPIIPILVYHLFFWWKRVRFYDNYVEFSYPFRPFKRKIIIHYENIQSIFIASSDIAGAPFKINVIEKEDITDGNQKKRYTFPLTGLYKTKEWQLIVKLRSKGIIITDNYFNNHPPNPKRTARILWILSIVYFIVCLCLIFLMKRGKLGF